MNLPKSNFKRIALILFSLLFLLSAFGKITHLEAFFEQLKSYQLIPERLWIKGAQLEPTKYIGWAVIAAEIALGLGILIGFTRRLALRGISVLMFLFAVAMSFALLENRKIDCGCFIPLWGDTKVSWWLVLRNIALAWIALLLSIESVAGKSFWIVALKKIGSRAFTILGTGLLITTFLYASKMNHIVGSLYTDLSQCYREHPGLLPGTPMPPLTLQTLDGGTINVNYSAKPRTLVLFFSATCPHCIEIAPWWNKLYAAHPSYQFFGVVSGTDEQIKEFVRKTGARFPIYYLGGELDRSAYRVYGFPRTVVVDPPGTVRFFLKGNVPEANQLAFEQTYLS